MRYFYGVIFYSLWLFAEIDFSKHQIEHGETLFAVNEVASNDVLNVRASPTHQSDVLYRLSPHADNIIAYEKNMAEKVGKNVWVSVRIGLDEGYLNGYVNARYLKFAEVFETLKHKELSLQVPYFMQYEITPTEADWLRLFHAVDINHYSGCDERDYPELLHQLVDFEVLFNVYQRLDKALMMVLSIAPRDFREYYDMQSDWFKAKQPEGFIEKVNYYGLDGYRYTMGAEGCGERVYFFKFNDKVLVIKEPFDDNPPILDKAENLAENWKFEDKEEILESIIRSIKVEV